MVTPISVSLIVPSYNTPKRLLYRCLDSILSQDIPTSAEIIVVFNGWEGIPLCDFSKRLPKNITLKVLHCVGKGVSLARNEGIQNSSYEWVMFVDADDCLPNGSIRSLLNASLKNNSDVVFGSYVAFMGYSKEIHRYRNRDQTFSGNDFRTLKSDLLRQKYISAVWGKLFSRSLFAEKHLCFNVHMTFAEDTEFLLKAFASSRIISYINTPVYCYIRNKDSAIRSFQKEYLQEMVDAMNVIRDTFLQMYHYPDAEHIYTNYILYHLTIIMVNYLFNPNSGWSSVERKYHYKETLCTEPFRTALRNYSGNGFSLTRKIALSTLKHRLYCAGYLIAWIRQKQFGN